ncbi:S-layer homology domain-containing protein [Paenibacillus sp. 1_12]|uniref:S-layer homology domain-containing protein n=1 Tax=Paenibacillus sp. 1_12 TaxID=1566278 RepID=UPI0008EBED5D|nr:S-layer homology domain-containing protein [Paenibacillus sp. 1_12]SFM26912.1 S-layer homology domain-containing protein [Paenibacillus sp. 1_12]
MRNKNILAVLLVLSLIFSMFAPSTFITYAQQSDATTAKTQLDKNLAYIVKTVDNPKYGTGSGDWSVLTVARATYTVPSGYYDIYYNNVVNSVTTLMTKNNGVLDPSKSTEHSRLILGLSSIGKDARNVAGYDITKALADYDYVLKQGMNGPIFALIAMDTKRYDFPTVTTGKTQATRDNLINYIVNNEVKKGTVDAGGWGLGSTTADVDITSMAMQALAPYYQTQDTVKSAVDRAVNWLSKTQNTSGSYTSFGSTSSESLAQVVTALSSLGIDAATDSRFIKNGNSALGALLTFALPDGGFKHISTGKVDGMATDQGTYALVAYDRMVNGKNRLYDMTETPDTVKPVLTIQGLTDQQKVTSQQLSFKVTVTDNVSQGIVPNVKLNGVNVTGINGEYNVSLTMGDNLITVMASDAAGNLAQQTFSVNYTPTAKAQLDKNLAYIVKTVDNPKFGTGSGDWSVLSLARATYTVPSGYYDIYYNNVVNSVKTLMSENNGVLHTTKSTEHSRLILGLSSIGKDARNVAGYDITKALADYDYVLKQGMNGPIYALIAMDTKRYDFPTVTTGKTQATRDNLINYIVNNEVKKGTVDSGGWGLGNTTADVDITSMAMQALAPYYQTQDTVKAAVDRAVNWLSKTQNTSGSYTSFGSTSSESLAQVVTALSSLGIDAATDSRFIKNGNSALGALLKFALPDGGFKHISTGKVDGMATDQGAYALVAYDRMVNGKNRLYDMTDAPNVPDAPDVPGAPDTVKPVLTIQGLTDQQKVTSQQLSFKVTVTDNVSQGIVPNVKLNGVNVAGINGEYTVSLTTGNNTITVTASDAAGNLAQQTFTVNYSKESPQQVISLPDGEKPKVVIPNDKQDYLIAVSTADSGKAISVTIPRDMSSKVFLQLPANESLPEIVAKKDDVSVTIPKGARVVSGDTSSLEWITNMDGTVTSLQEKVSGIVPAGSKLNSIEKAITMGGSAGVVFDQFITLTFSGMKGKDAAYIQNGTAIAIQKFSSDSVGGASGKNEYAYDSENDLIVKTKHFTDFVAFGSSTDQTPGGGGVAPQPTQKATLSIDKTTINKGYVISPKSVELQTGDTAWSVLQRELNANSIAFDYTWSSEYGSVYVQSIAGDGEFDHGSGSGWMYNVNGTYPNYGASLYVLKNGDSVQWRYTTNLGLDLGQDNSPWDKPTEKPTDLPADLPTRPSSSGQSSIINPEDNVPINVEQDHKESGEVQQLDLNKLYTDANLISAWAIDAIREASQKSFVSGSYGAFHPKTTITRAEFTKILVGILGLDVNTDKAINFNDISQEDWFYPYVNAAYKEGFISGYNDQFYPDDKLTREQMAVIIVNALGIKAIAQTPSIEDIEDVSSWAKEAVQTIVAHELMSGWDNRFQPNDAVTREMAAVVAMRAYQYKKDDHQQTNQPDLVKKAAIEKQINQTAAFMQQTVTDPVVASIGGDWTILGLARSGIPVPDAYYAKYYANVEKILKEKSGKLHAVKYTEYDRVILGLTSIGRNIDQVAGYNLREWLADYDTLIKQGINGPIFALIALDSRSFEIPTVNNVKTQTTRDLLIDFILKREITGGGWALGEKAAVSDPDITAMAIQGLTPYYKTNKNVQVAVDRALAWLSKAQTTDGGYASWESTNSESIAQVIVALTGLGINPDTDSRFIKNGSSAIDALLSFAAKNGGFYHIKPDGVDNGGAKPGEVDLMATDQAMYALVAYNRFLKGQTRLYDMSDVK